MCESHGFRKPVLIQTRAKQVTVTDLHTWQTANWEHSPTLFTTVPSPEVRQLVGRPHRETGVLLAQKVSWKSKTARKLNTSFTVPSINILVVHLLQIWLQEATAGRSLLPSCSLLMALRISHKLIGGMCSG